MNIYKESSSFSERTTENRKSNQLYIGKDIEDDCYAMLSINSSNHVTITSRAYYNLLDVFSALGGLHEFLAILIFILYEGYNNYKITKSIVNKVIIGKPSLYDKEYHLKKEFFYLFFRRCFCWKCCKNYRNPSKLLQKKEAVHEACNDIIKNRMDIKNFLHDSIDIQAIKGLILKSRHK